LKKGKNKKIEVKGMFPACCLPLWGREEVILITGEEYQRIIGEKQDFSRALK